MAAPVAVTVEQAPSVVLDDDNRVVEVGDAALPWFADHVGESVFDVFPGSEPLFRPYYDEARRTGRPVEFAQYYGGYVLTLRVEPCAGGLRVTWTTLAMLDTWTLSGLRASLEDALARLEDAQHAVERARSRRTLRVVGGAA